MKALLLHRHGEPEEVLRLEEIDSPVPGPGEVRVRMRLSPVNPSDFNTIRGTYRESLSRAIWNHGAETLFFDPDRMRPLVSPPVSPGTDGMGVVEESGGGWLARRLLGKRVVVLGSTSGNWREQVVVPAALSGITAAFIVAISRAVGETMVVAIAAGAGPRPAPFVNPFNSAETMTGHMVRISGGDLSYDSVDYESIFAIGLMLFFMTLALNIISYYVVKRFREVYE